MALNSSANGSARLLLLPLRILLMTFVFSAMTMAVGLACGLVVIVIGAAVQGTQPDVAMAYRNVAFPLVKAAAGVSFLAAAVLEVRHYLTARKQ